MASNQDQELSSSKNSTYGGLWAEFIFTIFSGFLVIALIYYGITYFEERSKWGIIYLSSCMIISSLRSIKGLGGKSFFGLKEKYNILVATLLIIFSSIIMIYFRYYHDVLTYEKLGCYDLIDYIIGVIALILVFLFTIKEQGVAIPIVALVSVFYMLFGPYLPGFLFHAGLNWERLLEELVLSISGIYGSINQIGATWIAIFLVFAGFLRGFGLLDYIVDFAIKIVGRSIRNVPQIALVASMIFGAFSGSASSNVAATGSFTIPLMKRFGVSGEQAGGIEAVASTGGQIMPPIMGASAFVMCDFLGTSYWHIVAVAFIPAIIFYVSVAVGVYFIAREIDIKEIERETSIKKKTYNFSYGIPFLIAVALFIVVMAFFKAQVMTGGIVLISTFVIGELFYYLALENWGRIAWKNFGMKLLESFRNSAVYCATLGTMIALLGIIVKALVTTGLAQRIAFGIVDVIGGNLFLLLLVIGILSILFGMAVATLAAYLIVVLMMAPSLQQLGVEPIVAHFSVFYLAMLSATTPPVAIAAAVAAGIANSDYIKTSWQAMKIGVAKFVLPFLFVFHPNILIGSWGRRLYAGGIGLLGLCSIAAALQWRSRGLKEHLIRAGLLIAGVSSFFIPTS